MKAAVVVIGILIMILGYTCFISPKMFVRFIEQVFQSRFGRYFAAGVRFMLGTLLLLAGSECRFPYVVQLFGALTIGGGLVLIVMSRKFYERMIGVWVSLPAGAIRAICVLVVGYGFFLSYVAV